MLETGDFAFDSVTGANVQILERIEAWGYTSYRVFNPSTGNVYKATEEQLKLMQSSITNSITQSAQGGGFALTSDEKGDDKIVKQDLGKAIQIKGDGTIRNLFCFFHCSI